MIAGLLYSALGCAIGWVITRIRDRRWRLAAFLAATVFCFFGGCRARYVDDGDPALRITIRFGDAPDAGQEGGR